MDELIDRIVPLAREIQRLNRLGVQQYTPIVDAIIRSRSRDASHIQHTLDWLLDFASSPDGLLLFKRLCRYYWDIDPHATADYVRYYREMWDSESEEGE